MVKLLEDILTEFEVQSEKMSFYSLKLKRKALNGLIQLSTKTLIAFISSLGIQTGVQLVLGAFGVVVLGVIAYNLFYTFITKDEKEEALKSAMEGISADL